MSTVASVRFIDAIGQNLGRVTGFPYWQDRLIASYTTRIFAASDSQFNSIRHPIRIDQAPTDQLFRGATVKDVETGAANLSNAVTLARTGRSFVVYIEESRLGEARAALRGHPGVRYWVADWTASESRALAFLAANADVVAVQWASPTVGAGLIVPGTGGKTVRELNVDLNVGRLDFWLPQHPAPKPESNASGIWKAQIEHNMNDETWRITPLAGQNVKMGQKMLSDHFAGAVDQHTGVWSIKGTPR